jgi:hypothetical protein
MADLSQYLDIPDALLQQQFPGVDIAAFKESIRQGQKSTTANATPVTQTIKTDPQTGEQTMTISGSAKDLSAANPLTPTVGGPAIPTDYLNLSNSASGQRVPYQAPAMTPPPAPAQPAPPSQEYLRGIAQMESGNRPMGYHDPAKSSAYGTYGMTNAAYQDVQRADPRFANRPITELTPDQQTQAASVYTGQNARYLQSYGVEPTQENLRLAHFLGAKGASDYLKTGAVSPAAAEANGGEERVRQIANQRLQPQGPVAPGARPPAMIAGSASSDVGLTPTEQAVKQMTPGVGPPKTFAPTQTPGADAILGINNVAGQTTTTSAWQDDLATAGNNATKLYAIAGNDTYPKEVQDIAAGRARQIYLNQQNKQQATQMIQSASEGDVKSAEAMMKALRDKSEDGSWVKAILLQGAGFSSAADRELRKLEGGTLSKAIVGGQSYTVQTSPDGAILKAWNSKGQAQDDITLARLNSESTPQGAQAYGFTGGSMIIQQGPDKGQEYRQRTNAITGAIENVITSGPNAGKLYTGAPGIDRSVTTSQLKMDYGVISKYREKYGTDILGALDQFRKDRGTVTAQEEQDFLNGYRFNQGPTGVGPVPGQGAPAQAQPGAASVAPATPAGAPAASGSQPVKPAAPGAATQVVPGAPSAPATATTTPVSNIPGMPPPPVRGMNEPETAFKSRVEAYNQMAKDVAAGEAKVKLALPQYESKAAEILKTIERVVGTEDKPAPGFTSNVGVRDPFGVLQLRGTEARGWQSQYKKLVAENFMVAFDQLKGAGAITDAEGQAAKEAQSALNDPGISEADFRKNAKILEDSVKRGVNRQRALAGLEPRYPEVMESSTQPAGTPAQPATGTPGIKVIKREKI